MWVTTEGGRLVTTKASEARSSTWAFDVRKQVVSRWACLDFLASLPPEVLQRGAGAVRYVATPSAWGTSAHALSGIDLGNDWL